MDEKLTDLVVVDEGRSILCPDDGPVSFTSKLFRLSTSVSGTNLTLTAARAYRALGNKSEPDFDTD